MRKRRDVMHYRRIAPSWIASLDAGGLHSESMWKLLDIPHILRTLKMRSYEASHFELYLSALLRCKSRCKFIGLNGQTFWWTVPVRDTELSGPKNARRHVTHLAPFKYLKTHSRCQVFSYRKVRTFCPLHAGQIRNRALPTVPKKKLEMSELAQKYPNKGRMWARITERMLAMCEIVARLAHLFV